MYKKALMMGLRFPTNRGVLSTEQLYQLSNADLVASIRATKKLLKKDESDDELSFLDSSKTPDVENNLRFEILKDVYMTKKAIAEEIAVAADKKAITQKIVNRMAELEDKEFEKLSLEELKAMLPK